MNKVQERSSTVSALKFHYASNRLFNQAKYIKLFIYLLALVSVTITVLPIPELKEEYKFITTMVSFTITIISDIIGQFVSNVKENAILEKQLYETEITGSAFSKIEYDREKTNELNELAIRKGYPRAQKSIGKYSVTVPEDISDDYSYLYLARVEAARTNFLLSRLSLFYVLLLAIYILIIVSLVLVKQESTEYLKLIIGFYPLISPIIKNITGCRKASSNCVKICADIDNFFADGDDSLERLARFYYYVQNIEFEMMVNRPTMYKFATFWFSRGVKVLSDGVTVRFKSAILELKTRSLMLNSGIAVPKAKELITKHEYTLEELAKKQERKRRALEKKEQEKIIQTITKETNKNDTPKKAPSTAKAAQPKKEEPKKTSVAKKPAEPKKTAAKISEPKKTNTKVASQPKATPKAAPKATKTPAKATAKAPASKTTNAAKKAPVTKKTK